MIWRFRQVEMASRKSVQFASIVLVVLAVHFGAAAQAPPDSSWKAVEEAMGRPRQEQPGDVFKFSMPRKDLHRDGVDIKAGLALVRQLQDLCYTTAQDENPQPPVPSRLRPIERVKEHGQRERAGGVDQRREEN